jgi:hypothetical protein
VGFAHIDQSFNNAQLEQISDQYQQALTGQTLTRSGSMLPLSIALVRETTVFREYGPLAGSTARLSYEYAPSVAGLLSRRTIDADARHYLRLGTNGVFASRIRGFRSDGDFPGFMYFGGNGDLRGYDYLQFVGQNVVYANAELRFPIIEAALTPIGVVGGVRGVFFAGIGSAWFSDQQPSINCSGNNPGFQFANNATQTCQVITGYQTDSLGNLKYVNSGTNVACTPGLSATCPRPPRSCARCPASGCRTAARPTASGSRRSCSASRSTSTGPGARCSTTTGKTSCSRARRSTPPARASAGRMTGASRASPCGSGTTSRGWGLEARGWEPVG